MSGPSDPLTGVKSFTIAGRMISARERCLGMTDEERRWRAQWLKDQILTPEEPREVPEYYKETTHFFRRLFKTPMNKFQKFLTPSLGPKGAFYARFIIGKGVLFLLWGYGIIYFFKYHTNNFELFRTVEFFIVGKPMYPDDPDYPNRPVLKPQDYYDLGFYSSVLCQKVKPRPPVVVVKKPKPRPKVHEVVVEEPKIEEEEVICVPPQPDDD